ncbi:MAG: hydroxymethylbilane synthase [Pseudomonadota bacterium]
MDKPVTLVSRQSPLAVAQAIATRAMLGRAIGAPEEEWETLFPLQTHVTTGDKNLASSLSEVGGKGLFVKEIEAALISGNAQIAIHSMKDMPAVMPEGLVQAAVPPRENPSDAFVTLDGRSLDDVPEGAVIGTSSVRRAAQLRRQRPDVAIVPFRGNVGTRLGKLEAGEASGTFLAEAGLRRLGHDEVQRTVMPADAMLPALGQGILCIQTRADDPVARDLCAQITCADTERRSSVERAFLAQLDGSCRTPMAGLAEVVPGGMRFRAEILSLDGQLAERFDDILDLSGPDLEAEVRSGAEQGSAIAKDLLSRASAELREHLGHA